MINGHQSGLSVVRHPSYTRAVGTSGRGSHLAAGSAGTGRSRHRNHVPVASKSVVARERKIVRTGLHEEGTIIPYIVSDTKSWLRHQSSVGSGSLLSARRHWLNPPHQLILDSHRESPVLLSHQWRRDEEIRGRTVAGNGNVVDHRNAKQRLHINVVGMRLERIREEDHEIDSPFYDCRADLLISAEWSTGEPGDIQAKLSAQYRACRACSEQIVVKQDAAIAPDPIHQVVLPVVVSDEGNVFSCVHEQQTSTGHR